VSSRPSFPCRRRLPPPPLAAGDAQQRRDQAPSPGPDVEHPRRVQGSVRLVPEGRGERRAGGLGDALEALSLRGSRGREREREGGREGGRGREREGRRTTVCV